MPLGRLLTFALNWLAGRPSALPLAAALVGPGALLLALPLVYRFVGRELGHPLYGVVAVILFGVTSVYQQAVYWFAASFSVFALDMLLLGLLAAQHYRWPKSEAVIGDDPYQPQPAQQAKRPLLWLGVCALCCALAPCWFASGILAGPLCCLYLLPPERGRWPATGKAMLLFWLARATPLLGSGLFLAVSLPLTAQTIIHLPHYQMQHTDALGAFDPVKGLLLTSKAVVENLLLGLIGISGVSVPWWLTAVLLVLLIAAGVWWWRRALDRRLLLLGIGMILAGYLLVYSARARWFTTADGDLAPVNEPRWSRYHLLPQLGLALFICGGLPAWSGTRFRLRPDGGLTRRQGRALACLLVVCFVIQLPRGVIGANSAFRFPDQVDALRRIEAVDACCREHHIGAEAARRCLGELDIPWSIGSVNGWEFLRGSPDPVERSDDEVRRLLEKCE